MSDSILGLLSLHPLDYAKTIEAYNPSAGYQSVERLPENNRN